MIEYYKIGVTMAMTNGVSQVLHVIQRDLMGMHKAVDMTTGGFTRMKIAAGGLAGVMAGGAILGGIWKMVTAAQSLNHELEKFRLSANLNDAGVAAARNAAIATGLAIPGTNDDNNVVIQRELNNVLNDPKLDIKVLPAMALANVALSRFTDKHTDLAQVGIKALELRGQMAVGDKVDPAKLASELDAMTRSIFASQGTLNPADYLNVLKRAGPAAQNMSQAAFWGYLPAVMTSMGSEPAGTAVMSMFGQLVGGVGAQRTFSALEQLHIINKSKVHVLRGGQVKMDDGAMPTMGAMMDNPFTWMHDVLFPRIDKMKDPIKEIQRIFKISSQRTAARLYSDVHANWFSLANQFTRYQNAPTAQQANDDFNAKDLGANIDNLSTAFGNLWKVLGEAGIPDAITTLQDIKWGVDQLTSWASTHKTEVAEFLHAGAELGLLLTTVGTAAVMGTAIAALGKLAAPTGLLGLAIALTAMGAAFDKLPKGLMNIIADAATGATLGRVAGPGGMVTGAVLGAGAGALKEYPAHPSDATLPGGAAAPQMKRFNDLLNSMSGQADVHKESYVPPGGTGRGQIIQTSVYLDKRVLTRATNTVNAHAASLPPNGSSQFDPRITPSFPSNTGPI